MISMDLDVYSQAKSHENQHDSLNHVPVEFCQNKLHLMTSGLKNETETPLHNECTSENKHK